MQEKFYDSADKAAQEVVNAGGTNMYAGNGKHLSAHFKAHYLIGLAHTDSRKTSLIIVESKVC
jgi:hypothetical protein